MLQPWAKHPSEQHRGQQVRISVLFLWPYSGRLIGNPNSRTQVFCGWSVICLFVSPLYFVPHSTCSRQLHTSCMPCTSPELTKERSSWRPSLWKAGCLQLCPVTRGETYACFVMGSNSHSLMLILPLFLLDNTVCLWQCSDLLPKNSLRLYIFFFSVEP